MGRSMLLYTAAAALSVTSLVLPVPLVGAAPNPLPTAQWSSSSSASWSSSSSNWTPSSKSSSWSSSSPSPNAKTWKEGDGEYKDGYKDGNKDENKKEGYNNGGDDAGHYSPHGDAPSHNYNNTSTSYKSSSSSITTPSASSSASSTSTSTSSAPSASTDSSGTQLTAEYLATSLNLTTHWKAPTPPALASTSNNGGGASGPGSAAQGYPFILEKWQLWGDKLNGGQEGNLHFVMDPYMNSSSSSTSDGMASMANSTSSSSSSSAGTNGNMVDPATGEMVLQVDYQKGSYRQGGDHSEGGATFFPFPMEMLGAQRVLLNYEVAFKQDFDWVKGGKLPGIFSGADERSCSGGKQSEEGDCFSVRMMWREEGLGEVYAYLPASNMLCPSNSTNNNTSSTPSTQQGQSIICNSDYGTSINRGSFNFSRAKYTPVTMYVALNDDTSTTGNNDNGSANAPAKAGNGRIQVWVNELQVVDLKGLMLSKDGMGNMELADSNPLKIFFSTFFGGSTPEWASKQDTSTYFKNLQVWTDASSSSSNGSNNNSNNGRDTINGQHKSSSAPPPSSDDDNKDEKSHAQARYGTSLMEKTSVLVVGLSYLVAVLAAMYL